MSRTTMVPTRYNSAGQPTGWIRPDDTQSQLPAAWLPGNVATTDPVFQALPGNHEVATPKDRAWALLIRGILPFVATGGVTWGLATRLEWGNGEWIFWWGCVMLLYWSVEGWVDRLFSQAGVERQRINKAAEVAMDNNQLRATIVERWANHDYGND